MMKLADIKRRVAIGAQSPTWGREALADREWLLKQVIELRKRIRAHDKDCPYECYPVGFPANPETNAKT